MNLNKAVPVVATVVGALAITGFLYVMFEGFGHDPHAVPFVLKGKPAPHFALQRIDGKGTFDLAQTRGEPVVVNFWASWCQPCKYEHEILQQAAQIYKGRVQFVGVVYQDSKQNVQSYLAQRDNFYPQLMDPTSATAIDYGVSGVPESYFIDPHGILRHKEAGVVSPQLLNQQLGAMLKEVAN